MAGFITIIKGGTADIDIGPLMQRIADGEIKITTVLIMHSHGKAAWDPAHFMPLIREIEPERPYFPPPPPPPMPPMMPRPLESQTRLAHRHMRHLMAPNCRGGLR